VTYPDSVQFLYSLGNEIKTAKYGLERIRTLLRALDHPERSCRLVHVAGTNGKGSTCAMIESGLRASGLRTGLFTSPHLQEPTERIRIGGQPITSARFCSAFHDVHSAAKKLLNAGALDLHPTYFETVTAMALLVFSDQKVDMAVLEVGLGGRLDATNVVLPELTVITPVDYDHEAYLGKSLHSIASEKAGILKAGIPAVFARQRPEAEAALNGRAAELNVPIFRTRDWQIRELAVSAYDSRFLAGNGSTFRIHCPLAGRHQVENALTAVAALNRLGIAGSAIEQGIAQASWPGRMERVSSNPETILDGAHNPAGARALAEHIETFYRGRRVWIIYGTMRDKAVAEIAGILFPLADKVIVTAPQQARAVRPEIVREIASHPDLSVAPTLDEALAFVQHASTDDVIFITGSLFLVGEARARLI